MMANQMGMTSAQISHVMRGDRDFTMEQAFKCSQVLGLIASEKEYFLEMVALARAGSHELREHSREKLIKLKNLGLQLKNQVPKNRELSDSEKALFYSSWHFSAVRLLCSIRPFQVEEIVERLRIGKVRVIEILGFLQEAGLCISTEQGYIMGQQTTFVPRTSPFVHKHHTNWRLKGLEQSELNLDSNLFFTSPISLSPSDFERIKILLTNLIKEFSSIVRESQSEELACLNLDFFKLSTEEK